MLVGRRAERARLDELIQELPKGGSGALVLTGEPGAGKTALLEHARKRANGAQVLSARGFEAERELPYAGLSLLLAPITDHLGELPSPQQRALEAALGRGPAAGPDRFAAYAGVLSLLAAAAEERPLLAVVDDAHWLDPSSAEALVFAARRLGEEGVGILFAAREDERAAFDAPGLPRLRLEGLDLDETAALLRERSGRPVSADVCRRLAEATGGNPLALVELVDLLAPAQLEGTKPLPDPLPAGADIERAFGQRIDALPADTQRALVVAAADAGVPLGTLAQALGEVGLDSSALEPAETERLLRADQDGVEFRHPLLRSVAYHRAPAPERRAAHGALAAALPGTDERARRAWHRAAAALEPDEALASELEAVAREAQVRGAPAAAASAFEAAARVTPEGAARARRLMEAAQGHGLAGTPGVAIPLLDAALAGAGDDPLLRADIQRLRGRIEVFRGSSRAVRELLLAEAERVRSRDETRAAEMLVDASLASIVAGDLRDALRHSEQAFPVAGRLTGMEGLAAHVSLAVCLLLRGRAPEARTYLAPAEELLAREQRYAGLDSPTGLANIHQWLEEYERAGRMLELVVVRARREGAVSALPFALSSVAETELRLGTWSSAYAAATESVALAEDTDQRAEVAHSLARLAQVEAGCGRAEECRAHVERCMRIGEELDIGSAPLVAAGAIGLLELGLADHKAAVEWLEGTGHQCLESGLEEPNIVPWAQDLAEAYVRLGDREGAERTLATLEGRAERSGGRLAVAAAARCRGLLAEDSEEAERLFRRALALHEERPAPFERARTELCFGERLRRARRRSEARTQLRAALAGFERLGAVPWADRARRELAASGERARRRAPDTRDDLTPQELQVALVVAEGATNREAAAQLFVSPKTIETHLSHIYRKLEVRSRTELARALQE
jgi:DNA-binding CsgD family transcriptional regulator